MDFEARQNGKAPSVLRFDDKNGKYELLRNDDDLLLRYPQGRQPRARPSRRTHLRNVQKIGEKKQKKKKKQKALTSAEALTSVEEGRLVDRVTKLARRLIGGEGNEQNNNEQNNKQNNQVKKVRKGRSPRSANNAKVLDYESNDDLATTYVDAEGKIRLTVSTRPNAQGQRKAHVELHDLYFGPGAERTLSEPRARAIMGVLKSMGNNVALEDHSYVQQVGASPGRSVQLPRFLVDGKRNLYTGFDKDQRKTTASQHLKHVLQLLQEVWTREQKKPRRSERQTKSGNQTTQEEGVALRLAKQVWKTLRKVPVLEKPNTGQPDFYEWRLLTGNNERENTFPKRKWTSTLPRPPPNTSGGRPGTPKTSPKSRSTGRATTPQPKTSPQKPRRP